MSATAAPRTFANPSRRLFSRREIEALIAEGRSILIVEGDVLKADAWMPYHPGGDKAIRHMVGRDATDEVNGLHSLEARQRMNKYVIGRVEGSWENFVPPIQGGKFRRLEEEAAEDNGDSFDRPSFPPSSESSREPSPIFDPVEHSATALRQRKGGSASMSRSSSATSISSTELDPTQPKLSHFDARTKKEIEFDRTIYPSLDPTTQSEIVRKYRLLNQRINAEGLYQCNYWAYAVEIVRYVALFAGMVYFLRKAWYTTSALCLGMLWHQLVFTAHDAGHMGITHSFTIDTALGIFIADFLGGLSLGWWKRNHNVHHIVTNSPEHDPDIQHMPFFAVSHRFLQSLRSTYYDRIMAYDSVAKTLLRVQPYMYYPVLLFGRFNLYVLSWQYLLTGQAPSKGPAWWTRWMELAGHIFFWYWFGYLVLYKSIDTNWHRFVFILVSHFITMPVHAQITLSHFAMSTADLGVHESFPQKMLRTTMDVDCPPWLDFIHGGLQFQVIHHLYPRIPRHNLRRTQKLVQEFCEEVNIPYTLYGFIDGSRSVISRLEDVARQAAILAECQKTIAKSEGFGLH